MVDGRQGGKGDRAETEQEIAHRSKVYEISGVKRYGTADEKRRRTESVVGITNLTIPILWIRNKKGNKNKGYPQWITFI
ncbi:hypothetical protein [Paenibacillus sp. 1781tsa1]|uniref:hypothetical protein n=1 Tax=Paenibacillus sp. 1781tsa1 TaxID=2953810 RepID=UPI00209FC9C2|nr:hypothetical protein [Paenibacillus sp. 1781tsa1]MCP1181457.1 hypothetical protein [Paenibacillus sp. 1781tsa1]